MIKSICCLSYWCWPSNFFTFYFLCCFNEIIDTVYDRPLYLIFKRYFTDLWNLKDYFTSKKKVYSSWKYLFICMWDREVFILSGEENAHTKAWFLSEQYCKLFLLILYFFLILLIDCSQIWKSHCCLQVVVNFISISSPTDWLPGSAGSQWGASPDPAFPGVITYGVCGENDHPTMHLICVKSHVTNSKYIFLSKM